MAGPSNRRAVRPELAILLLLVIAVPIIGWQVYKKVTLQFNEIIDALQSHPCAYVHNDKTEYDLAALAKGKSACSSTSDPLSCQDYHVHRNDNDFYLNVCNNVMHKPTECVNLFGEQNVMKSIGYQTGDGVCYYMGQLRTGKWSLLDPRHPGVGLKLTYTGGSECDGDTDRSTEFHFECNPEASKGEPVAVFGDCEFVVTWETALACPTRGVQLWAFILWALLALLAYLVVGAIVNVRYNGASPDVDAVPHVEFLRWFGTLVFACLSQVWDMMLEYLPMFGSVIWWVRERFGGGYDSLAGGGLSEGSDAPRRPPGGSTPGILDREGYDQL